MMEIWLSRSLFTNFYFSRWNSGYQGAFHTNFSFFLAIKEPSTRTFLFRDGILAIKEPFHELFFFTIEFTKCMIWGKTLFTYITKSIYIGSTSLKTLPLDLEPPLQGKEYSPPYCNEIAEKKANVFVPKITYKLVTRICISRI
jgi:hypothetical protein